MTYSAYNTHPLGGTAGTTDLNEQVQQVNLQEAGQTGDMCLHQHWL